MSSAPFTQIGRRELAHRLTGGLEITLYWHAHDNSTSVDVHQTATEETISFPVPPDRALDAFHHPFAHLASKGNQQCSLYVILGGAAKALGKPAARELGVGDYFGEMALIDGAPRSATIVATQELHLMRLPAQSVLRLARQHPAITLTMLRSFSTQLRRLEAQVAR